MREIVVRIRINDEYYSEKAHMDRIESILEGYAQADYEEYRVMEIKSREEYEHHEMRIE